MRQRRFEKLTAVLKSATLFALLFMSACASQQTKDSTIDEQIETMKLIEDTEKNSASIFVEQDMGLLSLHERNEREALKNLQNELTDEQLRIPATEEEANKEESAANEVKEGASWSTAKVQTLSKEEMSQELFDADSVVVQKGDSLSSLAEKHLGNKRAWARIWSINPNIQNPNVIEVGSKLYMPKAEEAGRGVASVDEAIAAPVAVKEESKEEEVKVAAEEAPLITQEVKAVAAPIPEPEPEAPKVTKAVKAARKKEAVVPVATTPTKIPDLAPIVEAKTEKTAPVAVAPKAEAAPVPAAKVEVAAASSTHNTGSSHTLDELLLEHLDSKRAIKFKGKEMPPSHFPPRKISSVNDAGPDEEVKVSMATAPKALTKVLSFAGLLIMAAVLAGFFFSKPKNQ